MLITCGVSRVRTLRQRNGCVNSSGSVRCDARKASAGKTVSAMRCLLTIPPCGADSLAAILTPKWLRCSRAARWTSSAD
jgi:hypothetical protein